MNAIPNEWNWTTEYPYARIDQGILCALQKGSGQFSKEVISLSRNQLKKLIILQQVYYNHHPVKSAHQKLHAGDQICIIFPLPSQSSELEPKNLPLEILYEDEYLAIINKPPGISVHPHPASQETTLVHVLLAHIHPLSPTGGQLRPGIVHRLDKNTSGILVISKTNLTSLKLNEIFSRHQIERKYWALCYGVPPYSQWQRIETRIGRNPHDRKKMAPWVRTGKQAITYWKVYQTYSHFASWIEVRLETGRTHQVRVHLTQLGHSILGDPIYGTPNSQHYKWKLLPPEVQTRVQHLEGQALHARALGFVHPITKKSLYFEAEPFLPFQKLLETLQKNINP